MINISQQQKGERFDRLPESLRYAITSEQTAELTWEVGQANHLNEERIRKLAGLVGYVILGFLNPKGLAKEIQNDLGINNQVAQHISDDIQHKVFVSVSGDIHNLYNAPAQNTPNPVGEEPAGSLLSPAFKEKRYPDIGSAPLPVDSQETTQPTSPQLPRPTIEPQAPPAPPTPEPPPPSTTSVPAFERPSAPQENLPAAETPPEPLLTPEIPADEPTPFIIHEEEEIEPLASGKGAPLSRPHFFKSTAGKSEQEKAVSARLEIGEESQVQEEPEVGRTKKEDVRVVNYTGPELKVDPFKRPASQTPSVPAQEKPTEAIPQGETPETQEKAPELTAEEPKEVSPDNIVNLKDLPK